MPGESDRGPIRITLAVWFIAGIGIFLLTRSLTNYYQEHEFWLAFIVGLHNTLFDVLFIGVLIFWLNKRAESNNEVLKYREELNVWNEEGSEIARNRVEWCIKRLNELGSFDILMRKSKLDGIDLTGMKLIGSNLSESGLFKAVFTNTDLRRAVIDNANLKHALLVNADLREASLRNANLDHADLSGSKLQGTDLSDAKVPNVKWDKATYDDHTRFPYQLTDFDKSSMIFSPHKDPGVFARLAKFVWPKLDS
jgi:hypothetical protein